MLRRRITGLVLVLSCFTAAMPFMPFVPLHVAQAQWDPTCPYPDGKSYQSQTFPRFEQDTGRLVVVSWTTAKVVQVVDQALQDVAFFGWSPDCRYLDARISYANGQSYAFAVWDMVHFRRVATFPPAYPTWWNLQWDPSSNYAVLAGGGGLFLLNIQAQTQLKLDNVSCALLDYYFDVPGGQLLAVKGVTEDRDCTYIGGPRPQSSHQVTAYSLQTGQVIRQYGDPNAMDLLTYFSVSPDRSKLALYTLYRTTPVDGGYLAVVERSSGAITELNAQSSIIGKPIFSPDNRYLAVAGYSLRVWDLQSLAPVVKDRQPKYHFPIGDTTCIFVDAHTIQYDAGGYVMLIDLLTGQSKVKPGT